MTSLKRKKQQADPLFNGCIPAGPRTGCRRDALTPDMMDSSFATALTISGLPLSSAAYHLEFMTLFYRLGLAAALGAFLGYWRQGSHLEAYALTALGAAGYVSLFLQLGVSDDDLVLQLAETLAWIGPAASAALVWLWIARQPAACQIVLWTSVAAVAGGLAALGAGGTSVMLVGVSLAIEFVVRRALMR